MFKSGESNAAMTERASGVSRELSAELWVVSSKTASVVKDLFGRMAALTFDSVVTRHANHTRTLGANLDTKSILILISTLDLVLIFCCFRTHKIGQRIREETRFMFCYAL